MKELKFTFKSVFFILIALITFVIIPQAVYADTYTSGDYTYVLSYTLPVRNATIIKYNGTGGNVVIPAELDGYKVTGIEAAAFSKCSNLVSITIPSNVISIGSYAFNNCSNLTSVTIPSSVTSIGNEAFSECTSLTNIDVDTGNTAYLSMNGVLYDKLKTTLMCYPAGKLESTYTIPNSVISIADRAFSKCSSLTSVAIPNSVTTIGSGAFANCGSLTSLTIPNSVKSIGSSAFYYCNKLTSITLPNGLTSIGYDAFSDCSSLTSITIPGSVTSIGFGAFSSCTGLTSVTISNGVTSISDSMFSFCENLTDVVIPSTVTQIGSSAFYYCQKLTSINIPDSVTSIGSDAFYDCNGLASITIPDSVKSIGEYAFSNCNKLTEARFLGNAPVMQNYVFRYCSWDFKIYYFADKTGFTNPWYGYQAEPLYSCTVTYNGNGSTGGATPKDSKTYFNNEKVSVLGNIGSLIKTGYTFAGWNTKADGTGLNYLEGSIFNIITADTTLYAKWTANVTGVTLDETTADLKIGGLTSLIATVNPADAINKNVTWSSSDTSVVAVDNAGNVTASGKGTAVITVKTEDGGYIASCIVTVASNERPVISGAADKTIKSGDSFDVKAGVTAADNEDGNLTSRIIVTGSVDTTKVGQYIVTYTAIDNDGNNVSQSITISVVARDVQVVPLIGSSRYDTAVKLSQSQFSTANTIIIVNGGAMADGLGATPLAKYKNAPLLLTETRSLPDSTVNEIKRLKAKKAIIVGGTGVVSDYVKQQMQALGLTVERISGSDRYGTSLEVAKYIDKNCYDVSKIVISNGHGEADALSIASAAGRDNMPIILVEKDNISAAIYNWLNSENIESAYIIGGTGVVSDNIFNKIAAITYKDISSNRLGGQTRFETNAMVIEKFYGSFIDKTYIAKGYELIDALAAGSVAAINGSPVVLSDNDLSMSQKTVIGKRYGNIIIRTGGGISNTTVNSLIQCLY